MSDTPPDLDHLHLRLDALERRLEAQSQHVLGTPDRASLEARIADLEAAITGPLQAIASMLRDDHEAREQSLALLRSVDASAEQMAKRVDFVRKLEAFFGPMLETMTPPLNGDDVATRAYVDAACVRLSTRLRAHVDKLVAAAAPAKATRRAAPTKRSPGRKR